MARITKITVVIEMADENTFTLTTHDPAPYGDNPRFVVEQMDNGMAALYEQTSAVLRARYGEQQRRTRTPAAAVAAAKAAARAQTQTQDLRTHDPRCDRDLCVPDCPIRRAQEINDRPYRGSR